MKINHELSFLRNSIKEFLISLESYAQLFPHSWNEGILPFVTELAAIILLHPIVVPGSITVLAQIQHPSPISIGRDLPEPATFGDLVSITCVPFPM